ncbi:hypothetical protein M404DRAFT_992987 [Pisolithus tinctorius Marx 270]|uniref:Uncharacterized protein n=1 Tax=Pisolithus tinctorius Marx 270 TaxID=870435 RepID=A0A0C3PHD1_PISTI|nr:hypothetical protein M404DRAFT_992987 [Pisolithus tinctorius Marx 270]
MCNKLPNLTLYDDPASASDSQRYLNTITRPGRILLSIKLLGYQSQIGSLSVRTLPQ